MSRKQLCTVLVVIGTAWGLVLIADGVASEESPEVVDAPAVPAAPAPGPIGESRAALGDMNCDASVDVFDIDGFVLAITAPEQYTAQHPSCDVNLADCNMDGSVDVFDIDAFIDILTHSAAHVSGWSDSGCLKSSQCGDDEFSLTIYPGALHVLHTNTLYNCCPDSFPVTMQIDDDVIKLTEEEVLIDPCWCVCCYDIEATVVNIPAGTYTLMYFWYDYDTGSIETHTEDVVIP